MTKMTSKCHQNDVQENVKRRQLYLVDTALGKPAPLYDLGVTPLAVAESVGPAGLHCPVSVSPNASCECFGRGHSFRKRSGTYKRVLGTQLSKSKLLLDSSLKLDIAAEYLSLIHI